MNFFNNFEKAIEINIKFIKSNILHSRIIFGISSFHDIGNSDGIMTCNKANVVDE